MKLKRVLIGAAGAIAICGVSAAIGWIGGFDFDKRTPEVALWCGATLFISAMWFSFALSDMPLDEDKK